VAELAAERAPVAATGASLPIRMISTRPL
jgi:hypothetical protein